MRTRKPILLYCELMDEASVLGFCLQTRLLVEVCIVTSREELREALDNDWYAILHFRSGLPAQAAVAYEIARGCGYANVVDFLPPWSATPREVIASTAQFVSEDRSAHVVVGLVRQALSRKRGPKRPLERARVSQENQVAA